MSRFINHYSCAGGEGRPAHEEANWTDTGDSMHNDKCPVCNAEIEPHHSDDLEDDEVEA